MNPYTTMTQARIQPRDIARALLTDPSTAAISLAVLERQRGFQAEAEVAWLLKEHGLPPASIASRRRDAAADDRGSAHSRGPADRGPFPRRRQVGNGSGSGHARDGWLTGAERTARFGEID